MSDLSALSHEYATNAMFADEINNLILKMKKYSFKTGGLDKINSKEIKDIQTKLVEFMEGLLVELKPESLEPDVARKRKGLIPAEVVERVRYQYKNALDYWIEDTKEIIRVLKSDRQIDTKGFELLDALCDAADSITSNSFRRLWRR